MNYMVQVIHLKVKDCDVEKEINSTLKELLENNEVTIYNIDVQYVKNWELSENFYYAEVLITYGYEPYHKQTLYS